MKDERAESRDEPTLWSESRVSLLTMPSHDSGKACEAGLKSKTIELKKVRQHYTVAPTRVIRKRD